MTCEIILFYPIASVNIPRLVQLKWETNRKFNTYFFLVGGPHRALYNSLKKSS
jgi:hypothetical protein